MPLKIYRRGEIWHYRGTVAGKLLRGTTKTADKATAQRIASERENRAWRGHLDGPESVLTFATAAVHYRQAGKPTRFLERVEDYWKDAPVRQIVSGAVRQGAMVVFPGTSAATRNRQFIVPTQAIINHAASLGQCQKLYVERFKVERKERAPASWEWIEAFMAHATMPHHAALPCFLFLTGARISEATSLDWSDVDLSKATALIRQTKIGDERLAHLPPVLVAALANIEWREGKVFGYSSRDTAKPMWRKTIRRAGIKPLTYHACRHGFATACLHAGIDPVTTAKRGGWKSAAHVFATYGHAMDDPTVTDRIVGTPATHYVDKKQKSF